MSENSEITEKQTLIDYYFKEYVRLTEQKKTASQASASTLGFSLVFQSTMFLIHLESKSPVPLILSNLIVFSLFYYITRCAIETKHV